jgi:predicted O-methyltransferase YrrM
VNGIVFDSPHVVVGAEDAIRKAGLMGRCRAIGGDFFQSVPAGGDAYLMKHIIHDWPDEECVKILKACRRAVNPGGKLLVIDNVIRPGNDFHPGKFLDLQMLIFPGGRERTEQEFRELFDASGWKLTRVIPLAVPDSVIEGVPV